MRTLFPLTLFLTLLVSCQAAAMQLQPAQAPEPAPSPPAQTDSTPSPSPEPEPSPTPSPTPTPEPYNFAAPVPESEAVEDEWFADAMFIGDSRTDGLRLYSGIREAGFLCYKGLTVFEVMNDKPVIQTPEGTIGVLQALEQGEYAKIYLMLGINELGYNNDAGFAETYGAMVDRIKELQPRADIYLQSLIPVSTEVCQATKQPYYITNAQIAVYNELIEGVALEKEAYYVNVQEAMVDETGELPADASSDGIHFHKDGYVTWYNYLKTHTVEGEAS